jgi:hypothetical protein
VPHRDIGRGPSGRAAGDAFFDRNALAGRTELLLHHRRVLIEIIAHVELAAYGITFCSLTLMISNGEKSALALSLFQPNGVR